MSAHHKNEEELQRAYYSRTAQAYNEMQVHEKDGHFLALCFLVGVLEHLEIGSVLDIGSGTGRALAYIKKQKPGIRAIGIEPVDELRKVGYDSGIDENELLAGDATRLQFKDKEFDLVCSFAVLHHIRKPDDVIAEMLRVAKKAIFVSDANTFGQGSAGLRVVKQAINFFGLWRVANFIRTRGKGYTISEGDGLAYSYSVFDNYKQIKEHCGRIHLLNLTGDSINPYRTSDQVALLGIKK